MFNFDADISIRFPSIREKEDYFMKGCKIFDPT